MLFAYLKVYPIILTTSPLFLLVLPILRVFFTYDSFVSFALGRIDIQDVLNCLHLQIKRTFTVTIVINTHKTGICNLSKIYDVTDFEEYYNKHDIFGHPVYSKSIIYFSAFVIKVAKPID